MSPGSWFVQNVALHTDFKIPIIESYIREYITSL